MIPLAPVPTPSGSPVPFFSGTADVSESCNADALCKWVYDETQIQWLANGSYVLILKPMRIILIILIAILVRWLLRRAIQRLTASTSRAAMPALLKPLRERTDKNEAAANTFIPERRRQRAEAIGSVLSSFVTAVVFTIATLLVLAELGFNLGPLLASAGIVGVAVGFGAQSLVKDLIAGLFMLLEDQYGVGDSVDLGDALGVVETVGLRVTTVRDMRGVLWYVRNGEIVRVGNKSQGWAMAVIDIPIGFVNSEEATAVLREAALAMAEEPEHSTEFLEPPEVIGVDQLTVDGAIIRTIAKTTAEGHVQLQRDLRRRLTEALEAAGIAERIAVSRMLPRSAVPPVYHQDSPDASGTPGGAT
ncbi:mechanosensitive ion channel family protein [Actinoplanes sp. NPDC026623]|uniref:mechanosensitive ion channel family protein n=1 Tax=Actinoplanes sp. NPDC026623 TaxID=3155610 RepID=UPI0033EBC7BC